MAKLMCNQVGFEVASEAMQVMGGLGYTQETLVEYCLRRTRGWTIAGDSIEMMKNRLAEIIFERRFSQRPPRAKASNALRVMDIGQAHFLSHGAHLSTHFALCITHHL